jgi:hypothetical protein
MTLNPDVVGLFPAKTQKSENSTLHGFELHRPSSKGIELRKNVVYWNPNGRSSMISCAIKSLKDTLRESLFSWLSYLEVTQAITKQDRKCMCQ